MSTRPHSRAVATGCDAKVAALVGIGVELHSIAAHAEVSDSTFRRARSGQPVVRAVARSIEFAVDDLHARHLRADLATS